MASNSLITDALHRVVALRESLTEPQAQAVMQEILRGEVTDAQIAGFLVALSMKGETVDEIVGFARAIRGTASALDTGADFALQNVAFPDNGLVDTCGTGGDVSGTFNISTAAAFVAAGAEVRVAKHGNRSVSSRCGSADAMEALGVKIALPPDRLTACLQEVGIVFLFAPALHSAMKFVQTARRELKLRTVFNLLGPLTNPAHASAQVVGVYSLELVDKLAEALSRLGLRRALVVHGNDGLDEITITESTRIAEVRDGQVHTYEVTPEEFGFQRASLEDIAGGDAKDNAKIVRGILQGEKSAGRDIVLLNAAAALVAAGSAHSLAQALPAATESIDSGAALAKLEALVKFTNA